ncbi:TPA: acyl-CoA dehydrogenase family protein [Staphylococcus pseudintermedius]|uniref:acyl-CoA dehydrogenase FadE n=1 Tax=Staphylococcus pseudintermedius TaxID=283734 RepID=UPI001655BB8F|nr:acyl-CoA dehydrogenase family protein [Staphylococcus pseudintermedius]ELX9420602.1 acyl-CoA dehydrogenase family protein [Staphylococcus pseudintermedius]MBC8676454.1 glutaryl-CoA dehydrogenase [Staphylococcus pseudintermedius]MCE5735094.1 acyl-CoA dehydrogenase family protein [Staphylococcus pseudintermedius]HCG2203069.1 acyl-CoA dehydrogenase family protein [Staphylococcus pseudintermedius]HCG2207947.1 acyl-CoA dehydrogenase family protein [Staphylococcus pseudintermedius]
MTTDKKNTLKQLYPEDILSIAKGLTDGEVALLQQLNDLLESKYRQDINQHWVDATVPEDYFQDIGNLNYFTNPLLYQGREEAKTPSQLFQFFMSYTIARFDVSLATLLGVHQGLGHNTFLFGGSSEQVAKYVPKLQSHELRTCFALTEPNHGSDVAGGLETVAERHGDEWVINGAKKWIGGAHVSDVIPVFAVNKDTGKPHCFVVRPDQEGVEIEVLQHKIAIRIVPNAEIRLNHVKVKEADRLQNITSFKDIAKILYSTRAGVAYMATGALAGTLRATLSYVKERQQFGKSISQYQLIQEKLAMIQGNLTHAMAMSAQLARMQENGEYDEVATSTAKMMNALRLRESVAMGRGITGGNGILAGEHDIARFFSDAEAIYTYEGTHEMNALVIGRALTGVSAFV